MNPKRKIVRLVQVRNERKAAEAKHMRSRMHLAVRTVSRQHGDALSGYALVAWSRDGEFNTVVNKGYGPHGFTSLAAQCHDAITRHISVIIAGEQPGGLDCDGPEGA